MSDPRLTEAFNDLAGGVTAAAFDRDALPTAIGAAHRRRTRRRAIAAVSGLLGLVITVAVVASPGIRKDTLVPAQIDPTPSAQPFTRGGAQPGFIYYLPKGSGTVNLPDHGGYTHYQYFRVPHAHAERQTHFTDGDLIKLATSYKPQVPDGFDPGSGMEVQLTNAKGTYLAPEGPYNVGAFQWFDGVFTYRLQAPIIDATHPIGLSYDDLLKVANSITQGHEAAPPVAFSPAPTPSGYLATPGPDVLRYWSPYFYAKNPPSDAQPKVTAEQALATDRANSSQGPQAGKTPHQYLALVSLIGPVSAVRGQPVRSYYRDRLTWVIEFGGISTDDTQGHSYTSCIATYLVDATTGEPFHDEVSCPQKQKATPTPSRA